MDLIERDKVMHEIDQLSHAWEYGQAVDDCYEIVKSAPTVEAIPINWIEGKKKTLIYQRIDLDYDDVDTAWDLKMKIEALEELIDEWNEMKEE